MGGDDFASKVVAAVTTRFMVATGDDVLNGDTRATTHLMVALVMMNLWGGSGNNALDGGDGDEDIAIYLGSYASNMLI